MFGCKNICKTFEENAVLDQVTLDLEAGSFSYLVGQSGEGKTTLLSILAGDLLPDEGVVYLQGNQQNLASDDGRRAYKKTVQLVNQKDKLDSQLTLAENCRYVLDYRGVQDAAERVDRMLAEVEIADLADNYPYEISGGELSRANLAQILLFEPQVLLVDEVTSALDPHTAYKILKLMERLSQTKKLTVFFSTHHFDLIEKFPHSCYQLKGGRLHETD